MALNREHKVDHKIQDAILFFVEVFERERRNPKPVLFHSLRVAFKLYELGYDSDTVIAAIFHDSLEDMNINYTEIESHFSTNVAILVQSETLDQSIPSKEERFLDSLRRAKELGEKALAIRASDLYDNSYYYRFAPTPEDEKELWGKVKTFLRETEEYLELPLWKDLVKKYKQQQACPGP